MLDILVLINVFILGWVCHSFYMAYRMRKIFKQIAQENGLTLDELSSALEKNVTDSQIKVTKVPNLFTEAVDNSIMLYNKDTGKFMGQASTVEGLAEQLYKFNKIKFALVNHDSKQYWFVEGKIKNDLKDLE